MCLWMLSARLFSREQVCFFGNDKCDVQGVVDYEYNACVPPHHPHIPEWECDVPTSRQALNGTSASYWKNLWDLMVLFKMKYEHCKACDWSVNILEMQHWESMSVRCALCKVYSVSYHTHMGVRNDTPNYLSHAITSVAELQCRKIGSFSLGRTWQNCAKTWWLILFDAWEEKSCFLSLSGVKHVPYSYRLEDS